MSQNLNWPPSYHLIQSTRARNIRLKICQRRGLQIITPKGFNPANATEILQKHQKWIERTWQRLQPLTDQIKYEEIPEQLNLQAINEIWDVIYQPTSAAGIQINVDDNRKIILSGNIQNKRLIKITLKRWLMNYALKQFAPWLQQLSQQTQLKYTRLTIRCNTSRWGSCSAKKSIALNCKLLFLPSNFVSHVMFHELCHTVHLNHSRKFWDLFRQINPNCHQLRKELKQMQQITPTWLEK